MRNNGQNGFTLVEILVVVSVITILVALTANATFSARQRAYVAAATSETDQLCAAFKARRLASKDGRLPFDTHGTWVPVTKELLKDFTGGTGGPSLLDLHEDRFEDGELRDPWGNAYQVRTFEPSAAEGAGGTGGGEAGNIVLADSVEVVVSFPNQFGRSGDWLE